MSNSNKRISVIIPVLNEEDLVIPQHSVIREASSTHNIVEIIYVDGGSTDQTVARAEEVKGQLIRSERGRAIQMNQGALKAKGDILYFLHADTQPPKGFDQIIIDAVSKGVNAGCFRMRFDSKSSFLGFFAWFTRFNHWLCRGGDQSLFINREHFQSIGGFNENYMVYEDLEFIGRLYERGTFKVLPYYVTTSARKYDQVGKYRLQFHFAVIHLKNYLGATPDAIHNYYKRHIRT